MDNKLKFFFDKQGDVLDISIGEPKGAISKEMENDIVMRFDPKTNKIVGSRPYFSFLDNQLTLFHIGEGHSANRKTIARSLICKS